MQYQDEQSSSLIKYLSLSNCIMYLQIICGNDGKRTKLTFNRPSSCRTVLYLSIVIVVIVLICFHAHVICMLGFINCYITWPFSSPAYLKIDLRNLPTEHFPLKYIPRRMHHILLGPMSQAPPADWLEARNACLSIHSHFERHYYWNDTSGRAFLIEHYSWFVKIWDSYETIVQKADALRYFVLHKFGGIFLDMDLFCVHPLDGLMTYLDARVSRSEHMFLATKAFPVGISNGFIITTKQHPLLERVINNLELFHRNFILPHATVVISTGPMCISIQMQLDCSTWSSIRVLDGKENMIGGKTNTPLFRHLGSGSWHSADDKFFKKVGVSMSRPTEILWFSIVVTICSVLLIWSNKNRISNLANKMIPPIRVTLDVNGKGVP